ncbi:hypothetical protein A2899_00190 [Candidatus Amesbacteria bacterium RIFCSPLOWO2_01_FULL_49_25]|uniref:Uncharacterized protein n=1 Tax=Candidatus Amesbacteria bacterium RIFCSPHIGHO2_01_FULL_48_32b TaxID=1797253 RepID=A0A1F4YGW7_9BACT|nr:MAG: hypothetical protein A2876_04935 [Candidatus Amesbacteria bacterium RIFCSPHIGHO2_01_FULL_48_32b]OGD07041.1 MAG: hypothetical protein A2899_00190 [Candidatus Amesbacteria bacterium RIFCSPLOWO2_01_FULL_49_25]
MFQVLLDLARGWAGLRKEEVVEVGPEVRKCTVTGCEFAEGGPCKALEYAHLVQTGRMHWYDGMELSVGCLMEREAVQVRMKGKEAEV